MDWGWTLGMAASGLGEGGGTEPQTGLVHLTGWGSCIHTFNLCSHGKAVPGIPRKNRLQNSKSDTFFQGGPRNPRNRFCGAVTSLVF